jgi:uncharacterized protein YkwD
MEASMRGTPTGRRAGGVRVATVLVALALPVAAACAPTKSGPANDLYGRVNGIRAQHGVAPLTACGALVFAADAHARDMAATGRFGHAGSDGSGPESRAVRYGYGSTYVGENIAFGQQSVDALLAEWMASGAHRQNIVKPDYQHVGFAYVNGYWVGVFGAGGAC